jgi:hypothetical protein
MSGLWYDDRKDQDQQHKQFHLSKLPVAWLGEFVSITPSEKHPMKQKIKAG